jgi:hypothetical protein
VSLQLDAVDTGHLHVDQEHCRAEHDCAFQDSLRTIELVDVVPRSGKRSGERQSDRFVIVNDVDVFTLSGGFLVGVNYPDRSTTTILAG